MAVFQISRIQIRRGQAQQGTGFPQLASGEMAWAIDTQELYIGNGAVSEGAPAVGNTKILTAADNILELPNTYQYRVNDATVQTGLDVNYPVVRDLQSVLDERCSNLNFGILANEEDQTVLIQHTVDQLWTNPANVSETSSRITLEFLPGTYNISSTIQLPSYVSIVGAGPNKTVFNFTGTGTVFEFVKDDDGNTIQYNNQPRYCRLEGFSVLGNSAGTEFFKLNSVRDSRFIDIKVGFTLDPEVLPTTGDGYLPLANTIGFGMYAFSSVVTTQRNIFTDVFVDKCNYSVYSKEDIYNNIFENCKFTNANYGIAFGIGTSLLPLSTNEQYGPRKNVIKNSLFENIEIDAIHIAAGSGNRSSSNMFNDVVGSQINYTATGNSSVQDSFDKIPTISGSANFTLLETQRINVRYSLSPVSAITIPIGSSTGCKIDYVCQSEVYNQMRRGTISVAINQNSSSVQLVDEFDYSGDLGDESNVVFTANLVNSNLVIYYSNYNSGDISDTPSVMTYTYSVLS